ncbi:unnamed protein product [Rhizophagus irregularis]|nr:unnamed protein product [Rhizophagus irregularis]
MTNDFINHLNGQMTRRPDVYQLRSLNDNTLSETIDYGVQFDTVNILPNSLIISLIEEWNDNDQDYEAMKLLPDKYKDYVCIRSTPDGNCFLTVHH